MSFVPRNGSLAVALLLISSVAAAPKNEVPPPRALPPKWPKAVSDAFFPDANEKLIGSRPDFGSGSSAGQNVARPLESQTTEPSSGDSSWSKLISAETLEDEIKKLQKQISENVTTPAKFKGGGFKSGRTLFSEAALLFAIIAEYEGEVRWKDKAAGVRDLMSRAGHNCKVGTDASFAEAKLRKEDLELLVQGGSVSTPASTGETSFAKVSDRPPLMQRLEQSQQQGIAPWSANSTEFQKNATNLLREAELMAAIAAAIQKEGYEYADDDSYRSFAQQMQTAAREVAEAVKNKNYDAARAASGNIEKSCSGCHEGFRS